MRQALLTLVAIIFISAAYCQKQSPKVQQKEASKLSLMGRWNKIASIPSLYACSCDTMNYWNFNPDGTFRYGYQLGKRYYVAGRYNVAGDSITLEFNDKKEVIKYSMYKSTYLMLGAQNVSNYTAYKKDKFIGSIDIHDPAVIFNGRFFVDGNQMEADLNNEHVVFDSVYAFKTGSGGSKINVGDALFVHAFNKAKKISLALKFGLLNFDTDLNSESTSLIGSGSVNAIGASSDATVSIENKYFNTSSGVFGYPNGIGFGQGTGKFSNVNYTEHRFAFPELSAEFEFTCSNGMHETDRQGKVVKKAEELIITNGKFYIRRLNTEYGLNVLKTNQTIQEDRKKAFDADFNAGKSSQ